MNNPSTTPASLTKKSNKKPYILGCVVFGGITLIGLLAFLLLFWVQIFTERIRVQANSNAPTLGIGDYILVDRSPNKINTIKRGDFVMLLWNQNLGNAYIYRVIGLPGDSIKIQSGKVYVNDNLLFESYIAEAPKYEGSWKVSADQFFVLGDNRNMTADSHLMGPVPYSNVIGKALVVYWPVDHFKLLK